MAEVLTNEEIKKLLTVETLVARIEECKKHRLIKLDLSSLYIRKLPEQLSAFRWLKELDLSDNLIEKLPDWIGNLESLKKIKLGANRFQTLPHTFGNLTALEKFELEDYNENESVFTYLPDSFGNLSSLKYFHIYCTKVNCLPESFVNLNNLIALSIERDSSGDFHFPHGMKNMKSLKKICISVSDSVPDFIGELTDLTELDISHNKLLILPEFIGNLIKLKKLNLHSTWITELPEWIVNLKNLEDLDISCNDISENPGEIIKKLPKIREFWDGYNEYNLTK